MEQSTKPTGTPLPSVSSFRRWNWLPEKNVLTANLVLGLVLFTSCLFVFGSLAEGIASSQPFVQFDIAIVNAIHANTSPTLIQLMFIASVAGSQLLTIVSIVLGIIFILQRRWYDLLLLAVAVGGEELVNTFFKLSFHRVRPTFNVPIATGAGFSFPSGHAMASIVFYGLIAYWLMRRSKSWLELLLIALICFIIVLVIGFSRIYLGVHYPSDVAGGYVAGFAWLIIAISSVDLIQRWWQKRRPQAPAPVVPPPAANVPSH